MISKTFYTVSDYSLLAYRDDEGSTPPVEGGRDETCRDYHMMDVGLRLQLASLLAKLHNQILHPYMRAQHM